MLGIIKNIIFKIIYFLVIVYLIIFIPTLWGEKPLVIISGSMEPTLNVGGILYYQDYEINEFQKDDVIVYKLEDHIISHRVYDITENGIITKGDANNTYDNLLVTGNMILGKGTNWCIPLIGYYADFIYTHKIVLWISLLTVIIDMIHSNKKGKKYEKDN